jgi:hypothetical protein
MEGQSQLAENSHKKKGKGWQAVLRIGELWVGELDTGKMRTLSLPSSLGGGMELPV